MRDEESKQYRANSFPSESFLCYRGVPFRRLGVKLPQQVLRYAVREDSPHENESITITDGPLLVSVTTPHI